MNNSLIEALKEGLRVVVIAIIPIAIDGITKGNLDFKLVGVAGIIAGLRFIDKLLHETGKAKWGLTRF